MTDIQGKVAIVTGSSSGIGGETARLAAATGWHVLVNYNSNRDGAEAGRRGRLG